MTVATGFLSGHDWLEQRVFFSLTFVVLFFNWVTDVFLQPEHGEPRKMQDGDQWNRTMIDDQAKKRWVAVRLRQRAKGIFENNSG